MGAGGVGFGPQIGSGATEGRWGRSSVPGDGAAAAVFAVGGGGCAAGVVRLGAAGEQCDESQQCGCAEEGEHEREDAEQQQQGYADCEQDGERLD